ncbi:MAG: hypothetical protein MUF02_10265 [Acidobacteria bacterium]|nr:hypothetical protein [Acidobacteriota bacterium]
MILFFAGAGQEKPDFPCDHPTIGLNVSLVAITIPPSMTAPPARNQSVTPMPKNSQVKSAVSGGLR